MVADTSTPGGAAAAEEMYFSIWKNYINKQFIGISLHKPLFKLTFIISGIFQESYMLINMCILVYYIQHKKFKLQIVAYYAKWDSKTITCRVDVDDPNLQIY